MFDWLFDPTLRAVSIRYNQARTLESQHQLEAAVAAYKALLEEYPKYIDCESVGATGLLGVDVTTVIRLSSTGLH